MLQSLTVYKQTLRNTATLGTWDSVEVNAWDSASVLDAGPITLTPYEGRFTTSADTMDHELKFSSNCGSDSVSPILQSRVTTSAVENGTYVWKSKFASQRRDTQAKVTWNWTKGAFFWKVGSDTLWANNVWDSPDFALASDTVAKTIVGWKGRTLGLAIQKPTIYGSGLPPVPNAAALAISRMEAPFRKQIEAYFTGAILPSFKDSVDAIGKGSIDSTRLELRLYKSVFAKASSTAVRPRTTHPKAFAVTAGPLGWTITAAQPTAISIYAVDGTPVRTFAPTRRVVWDGKDASGAKVQPGMWVVRVHGQGAVPVLVR